MEEKTINKFGFVLLNIIIFVATHFMIMLYYAFSEAMNPTLSDSEIAMGIFKLVYPKVLSILIVFGILFFINKHAFSLKTSLYIFMFSVILSFLVIGFWTTDYYVKQM